MKKMESKKIICDFCGAEFEDTLPACSFCGSSNYKGAEAEYLRKLEGIRENVEDLGRIPAAETKQEIYKQGKFLKRIFIVLGVVFALFLSLFFWINREEKRDPQADYLWKKMNYPIMDEMYEQQEYDELVTFYKEAWDADYPVQEWEHDQLCWLLVNVRTVESILEAERNGVELSEADYSSLLYYGFKMSNLKAEYDLPEEDWDILQPRIQPIVVDFENRWEFTEEDLKAIEKERSGKRNYVSFDFCDKYIAKWMKGRDK